METSKFKQRVDYRRPGSTQGEFIFLYFLRLYVFIRESAHEWGEGQREKQNPC